MSFTRFYDDPARIKKQLQESTDQVSWIMNVPGNGLTPSFINDPFILSQKWGGNLRTNFTNIESDLKGLSRSLTKDCLNTNDYQQNIAKSSEISYPVHGEVTQQPRTTHPAWELRTLEQSNWNYLPLNPQENVVLPFQNNLNTRILVKDNFNK